MTDLSGIPSVDRLLQTEGIEALCAVYGREMTVHALREVLNIFRKNFSGGSKIPENIAFIHDAEEILSNWFSPTLRSVLNATGVILHTNLGRAPLSEESIYAVQMVMQGYSTLEFNLASGKRGSRLVHSEDLLVRLTGAEAALVVNNNASAVLLALTALAKRRRVIISRSQLIEIGGGFRIPDVMKQSGARLVEVGTTNRVHIKDYEEAMQEPAVMILRAHSSNFRIIGFTSEPELKELVKLAHKRNLFVMDDLGSGALLDTSRFGLLKEPMVQESIGSGVDLVCFSGDKLMGGPQAGILVGKKELISKLKKHPLARAVRADKMALAAMSATLMHYLKEEAEKKVPVWQMISAQEEELQIRAQGWRKALGFGDVVTSHSTVGGGSLPEETLPTYALKIDTDRPDQFLAALREQTPPVIARIESGSVLFDPRTVFKQDDASLISSIRSVEQKIKRKDRE